MHNHDDARLNTNSTERKYGCVRTLHTKMCCIKPEGSAIFYFRNE